MAKNVWCRAAACLAWTLAFAYSFAPFTFSPPGLRATFDALRSVAPTDLADLPLHALTFVAVGLIDRLGFAGGPGRGVLLCLCLEAGQLFVALRHPTLLDLAMNAAGFLGGRSIAPVLYRTVVPLRLGWEPEPRMRLLPTAPLAAWGIFWCGLLLLPARLVTLGGWDPSFPLVIGNEVGGERPWEGAIQYVGIYGRALTSQEAQKSAHQRPGTRPGAAARASMGLLAGYDFSPAGRLEVKPTGALNGDAPDIRLPPASDWNGDGLALDQGTLLTGAEPATRLIERMASAEAFAVEVWCRPASVSQEGPARIVGISDGPFRRNFTLGQEGAALVFRVRSPLNGPNGTDFELRSPALLSDDRVQMVATYARGASSLFINGARVASLDLREPAALLGLGTLPTGSAAAAMLAALSLILVSPASVQRLTGGPRAMRLLVIGYGVLLIPAALSLVGSFRPADDLYFWFGPALLVSSRITDSGAVQAATGRRAG